MSTININEIPTVESVDANDVLIVNVVPNPDDVSTPAVTRTITVGNIRSGIGGNFPDPIGVPPGNASEPGIAFVYYVTEDGITTEDRTTGLFSPEFGAVSIANQGIESFTVNPDRKVGINQSLPNNRLSVRGTVLFQVKLNDSSKAILFSTSGVETDEQEDPGGHPIMATLEPDVPLLLGIASDEKVRITPDGSFLVGTSSNRYDYQMVVEGADIDVNGAIFGNGGYENTVLISQQRDVTFDDDLNPIAGSKYELIRFNEFRAMGLAGENFGSAGQVLSSNGSLGPATWKTISIEDTDFANFPNIDA